MKYIAFHIDAFTDRVFYGNPAVVVFMESEVDSIVMQSMAKEFSLPETAFVHYSSKGIVLRWFTPEMEMDLCGHATLAAAHVMISELKLMRSCVQFITQSGTIVVEKRDNLYYMDLPVREAKQSTLPMNIQLSLNISPVEVLKARDYLLIYNSSKDVESINIERSHFDKEDLGCGGVIVSAASQDYDFVSRFFTPKASILEDPVTGSAHCTLVPYWAKKTGKDKLIAKQISSRGGELFCELNSDSVTVAGAAVTYSKMELYL